MATALITGASSGIGYKLASLFAADKHDLILVARRADLLNEFAETLRDRYRVQVDIVPIDLANSEAAQTLYDRVRSLGRDIEYLVNDAGFGDYGLFVGQDWTRMSQMITLNIVTLSHLTHLCAREMIRRKRGRIMNVASIAGFQPCPTTAVYAATKAYVLSLTEALHNELRGTNVTATALCPGPTQSGFQEAANMNGSALFKGFGVMTSGNVASIGYRGMMRGKAVVVPGIMNILLTQSVRLSPRLVTPFVSRFLMRRTKE